MKPIKGMRNIHKVVIRNQMIIIIVILFVSFAIDNYLRGVIERDLPYLRDKANRIEFILREVLKPSDYCLKWGLGGNYASLQQNDYTHYWNNHHIELYNLSGKEFWPEEVYIIVGTYCKEEE